MSEPYNIPLNRIPGLLEANSKVHFGTAELAYLFNHPFKDTLTVLRGMKSYGAIDTSETGFWRIHTDYTAPWALRKEALTWPFDLPQPWTDEARKTLYPLYCPQYVGDFTTQVEWVAAFIQWHELHGTPLENVRELMESVHLQVTHGAVYSVEILDQFKGIGKLPYKSEEFKPKVGVTPNAFYWDQLWGATPPEKSTELERVKHQLGVLKASNETLQEVADVAQRLIDLRKEESELLHKFAELSKCQGG